MPVGGIDYYYIDLSFNECIDSVIVSYADSGPYTQPASKL